MRDLGGDEMAVFFFWRAGEDRIRVLVRIVFVLAGRRADIGGVGDAMRGWRRVVVERDGGKLMDGGKLRVDLFGLFHFQFECGQVHQFVKQVSGDLFGHHFFLRLQIILKYTTAGSNGTRLEARNSPRI